MKSWLGIMTVALAATVAAAAQEQDPFKSLPKSYKVEFENDWVQIARVHYDAKAKLPEHEHPEGMLVFLYLNASDGVLYQHNADEMPVRRPAVVPGAIRIAKTPYEHHTVTNLAETPSDFIRVLLKTEFGLSRNPLSRMPPSVMEYDHERLHVSRIIVQPNTKTRIEATRFPILRIAVIPDKSEWRVAAKDGYRFLDKGTTEEFTVSGNVPMQLVTIELRTPIAKRR